MGCVGRGIGSGTNIGIDIRVLFYEGLDFWDSCWKLVLFLLCLVRLRLPL
jgi:hypothetical protein